MLSMSFSSDNNKSVSGAIVKEYTKRFWLIPVLSLLAYFLTCLLPMMLNYRDFVSIADYACNIVSGGSPVVYAVLLVTSVVSSAAVFSYLHDPVSANSTHAMPARRSKLYFSSVLTGWLFTMAPVAVFGLSLFTMRGADFGATGFYYGNFQIIRGDIGASELFTLAHMGCFLNTYLFVGTFIYAVCCLAAILSGKTVIHVLLSLFLIGLPASILGIIQWLCKSFLYGFSGDFGNIYRYLSPFIIAAEAEDGFVIYWKFFAYYMFLSLVLFVAGYLIYKKVKIERVGSSTTFPLVADVLCLIITFMGSILFGLTMAGIMKSSPAMPVRTFVCAAIPASVIVYLITRMIADSTPSVFRLSTLKKYAVFLVILLIAMAFTTFDVTKYGNYIPEKGDVASVTVNTDFLNNWDSDPVEYSNSKSIDRFLALQQHALDNRSADYDGYDVSYNFTLSWKLKSGKTVTRSYDIFTGTHTIESNELLKTIYDDPAFRKSLMVKVEKGGKLLEGINDVLLSGYDPEGEDREVHISREDWEPLLKAMNKDIPVRTYEQAMSDEYDYYVGFHAGDDVDYMGDPVYPSSGETLTLKDKNTTQFLKEKGYLDTIIKDSDTKKE